MGSQDTIARIADGLGEPAIPTHRLLGYVIGQHAMGKNYKMACFLRKTPQRLSVAFKR